MKKIYFLLFFIICCMLAKSQQMKTPFRLRTDLLLHTNQVSKMGIAVSVPLESAILQKDSFQFPVIYNQHPLVIT